MDENEFERQLDRLANGLGAIWVLHGEKVSDQLDQSLNETISYNLDREIWLEIISRLNHHPDLSDYVSQRVLSGAKPQTYSNEELGPHASTSEQLRWAWKELKGTTKSVQAICNGANLNSGIATVLRVAKIEEELMHTAIGLMVDYTCAPEDTVMHERALADSYNGLEKANKWSLLPLFFNEQMTKRESRFLIDGEANDAYFEIFQRRLKADGLSINAVKKQFLESGIGELMPCLHQCDPSAWRIGEGINSSQLNRSSISTKREPSFSDENLDQLFKEDLHHENEKLENDKDFPKDRYQKNSSDDIRQVFHYNVWTHDPEESRIWIRTTDTTGKVSLELQYFYLSQEVLFADVASSSYLDKTDPLKVTISVWKNLLEIFSETSSLTFETDYEDSNEQTKWEYYLANLNDSWTFKQALKTGDSLIITFDERDEHKFGLAGMENIFSEVDTD